MTRETTVPEEAVQALARELASEHGDAVSQNETGYYLARARNLLQAALPALRSEWEASLLSDEAVEAAVEELPFAAVANLTSDDDVRDAIRAALSTTGGTGA